MARLHRSGTSQNTQLRQVAVIQSMIADLERSAQILDTDIATLEERARIFDLSDAAYPILARRETIAALGLRLSTLNAATPNIAAAA